MKTKFDVIIAGAGMGGLTASCFLAKAGYSVLVLEKAHAAGGCSSSFKRKGYGFEAGATTLTGFDEHQPLRKLEQDLGIEIPKVPLNPSMAVHQNGKVIVRWRDREKWISEVARHFGETAEQNRFWNLAYSLSDVVWKVSGENNFFPPVDLSDWFKLLSNDPREVWVLPYAFRSVKKTASDFGISNPDFCRFLDEQLLITAQSTSGETPFLFGAPAITYTNSTNYYVPGGLIEMVKVFEKFLETKNGTIHTREGVRTVEKTNEGYRVTSEKNITYDAAAVISNIPVWNMAEVTAGEISEYFREEALKYQKAWGAFTMGIVTDDVYPDAMPLHHQIHIHDEEIDGLASGSLFVSFSMKGDQKRAGTHERVLNVSAHAFPEYWFALNGHYDEVKVCVQEKLVKILRKTLPGFNQAQIKLLFSSTPVTWSNWVYRKKGRVGGIPQSMARSLLDWTPNKTPFDGLYLCGDTVFPGQGIPGATLSGINVYFRVQKHLKNLTNH